MNHTAAPDSRKKVFISYSRIDSDFAEKLCVSLDALGFDAFLDKKDILPGEPWKARFPVGMAPVYPGVCSCSWFGRCLPGSPSSRGAWRGSKRCRRQVGLIVLFLCCGQVRASWNQQR